MEAGAADGMQESNSLHLEHLGWRGALIEPWIGHYHAGVSKNERWQQQQGVFNSPPMSATGLTWPKIPTMNMIFNDTMNMMIFCESVFKFLAYTLIDLYGPNDLWIKIISRLF